MKARSLFIASILMPLLATNASAATAIDFNDGTAGFAIGSFYASAGVSFTNGTWDRFVSISEASVGAGGLKLIGTTSTYSPKSSSPIIVSFSDGASSVSIQALNVGANGTRIDAYDAQTGGSLVSFSQSFGTSDGASNHPLISVVATYIGRIELYQPSSVMTEGLLFDNLVFAPVPEPTPLALFLLGGLSLLWAKGRKSFSLVGATQKG